MFRLDSLQGSISLSMLTHSSKHTSKSESRCYDFASSTLDDEIEKIVHFSSPEKLCVESMASSHIKLVSLRKAVADLRTDQSAVMDFRAENAPTQPVVGSWHVIPRSRPSSTLFTAPFGTPASASARLISAVFSSNFRRCDPLIYINHLDIGSVNSSEHRRCELSGVP